jgi:hypothetical protein
MKRLNKSTKLKLAKLKTPFDNAMKQFYICQEKNCISDKKMRRDEKKDYKLLKKTCNNKDYNKYSICSDKFNKESEYKKVLMQNVECTKKHCSQKGKQISSIFKKGLALQYKSKNTTKKNNTK